MTHTDVMLVDNGGVLVPSIQSVKVQAGDTIAFATSNGRAAFAFFSPDAESVLQPKPSKPCPIAAGGKSQFSFGSSHSGAYSVYFGYTEAEAPGGFSGLVSEMLALEINPLSVSPTFSGPAETVGSGHGG